jgi:integrase
MNNNNPAKSKPGSLAKLRFGNPAISAISRFEDLIWDFSNETGSVSRTQTDKQVKWNFMTPEGFWFVDKRYIKLMRASKQFIFALRWHPIEGPSMSLASLRTKWSYIVRFIVHLLSYPIPVLRFSDVLPHHCEDYVKNIVGAGLSRSSACGFLYALSQLFAYSKSIEYGLVIDPLGGRSAGDLTKKLKRSKKTKIIPENTLGEIFRASVEYIEVFSPYLFSAAEMVARLRGDFQKLRSRPDSTDFYLEAAAQLSKLDNVPAQLQGTRLQGGVTSVKALHEQFDYLQFACFVIVAITTGMRLSELMSMRRGCLEIESHPGEEDLFWVKSRIFKMQFVAQGRKAKWLGGPICAKAVFALERLLEYRSSSCAKSAHLFSGTRDTGSLKVLSSVTIRSDLMRYMKMLGIVDSTGKVFHVYPKMFRSTFAFLVARHDTTNLLALKEHMKHVSLRTTEYYAGTDVELWMEIAEEVENLSYETFDRVLRSEHLAGPGGVRLKKNIDQAIADGRLPKEFRGQVGGHLRKKMIIELINAGERVYPCAASNYCWFDKDSAMCTQGDEPILKHCNPGACRNSSILPEHIPHWEKIAHDSKVMEKEKPESLPVRQALRDIHVIAIGILKKLKKKPE